MKNVTFGAAISSSCFPTRWGLEVIREKSLKTGESVFFLVCGPADKYAALYQGHSSSPSMHYLVMLIAATSVSTGPRASSYATSSGESSVSIPSILRCEYHIYRRLPPPSPDGCSDTLFDKEIGTLENSNFPPFVSAILCNVQWSTHTNMQTEHQSCALNN